MKLSLEMEILSMLCVASETKGKPKFMTEVGFEMCWDSVRYLVLVQESFQTLAFERFGFSPGVIQFYSESREHGWLDVDACAGFGLVVVGEDGMGEEGEYMALLPKRSCAEFGDGFVSAADVDGVLADDDFPFGPLVVREELGLPGPKVVVSPPVCVVDAGVVDVEGSLDGFGYVDDLVDEKQEVVQMSEQEGYCYLACFNDGEHVAVAAELGKFPTLKQLLRRLSVSVELGETRGDCRLEYGAGFFHVLRDLTRSDPLEVLGAVIAGVLLEKGNFRVGFGQCMPGRLCSACQKKPTDLSGRRAVSSAGHVGRMWNACDSLVCDAALVGFLYRGDCDAGDLEDDCGIGEYNLYEPGKYVVKLRGDEVTRFNSVHGFWLVVPPATVLVVDGYRVVSADFPVKVLVNADVQFQVEGAGCVEVFAVVGNYHDLERWKHVDCRFDPSSTQARCWSRIGGSLAVVGDMCLCRGDCEMCSRWTCYDYEADEVNGDGVAVKQGLYESEVCVGGFGSAVSSARTVSVQTNGRVQVVVEPEQVLFLGSTVSAVQVDAGDVGYVRYEGYDEYMLDDGGPSPGSFPGSSMFPCEF